MLQRRCYPIDPHTPPRRSPGPLGTLAAVFGQTLIFIAACQAPSDGTLAQQAAPLAGGEPTESYPAVGILSFVSPDKVRYCSGTLVGACWVMTAAHCVDDSDTTAAGMRFHTSPTLSPAEAERNDTGSAVEQFALHPDYANNANERVGDVALVKLAQGQCPILTPVPLSQRAPTPALELTLVGYGATAYGNTDFGVKRVGSNRVDEVQQYEFTLRKTRATDSMACSGDSGGPALVSVEGQLRQIGVHSRGGDAASGTLDDSCGDNATTYEARVDRNLTWLLEQSHGEILAESDSDREPPTLTIEQPSEGALAPGAPDTLSVVLRAEDDTRVQYVDLYLQGRHAARLMTPPYRVDGVTVDALQDVQIDALAVDATGKETRASRKLPARLEQLDSGLASDGGSSYASAWDAASEQKMTSRLAGSSGCDIVTPADDRTTTWLFVLATIFSLWRRRRSSSQPFSVPRAP